MSEAKPSSWTIEDMLLASVEERGPFYEWLQRVHETGGDELLRRFVIELLRSVEPVHFQSPTELIELLVAFTHDPDAHRSKLGWWMAADSWPWRETAKLALEWGRATRTGKSLVRQVAVVTWVYLHGQDPTAPITAIREQIPELPD